MPEEDLDRIIRWLDASEQVSEQRRAATYDGVLGKLPEWVPKWHQHKFNETRNRLLDRYLFGERLQHEQIVAWINEYGVLAEENEGQFAPFIPREIYQEIGYLAHLRYAVSLGSEEGLVMLAGDNAVLGRDFRKSQSEKAKKPRDNLGKDGETITLSKIIADLAARQDFTAAELWPELFAELELHSLDPVEIEDGSDRHKNRSSYDKDDDGHRKSITFGRFANAIAEKRKKKSR